MSLPPANWYPDPTAPGTERYWDGGAWGQSTRAAAAPQAPPEPVPAPQAPAPVFAPQEAGPQATFTPREAALRAASAPQEAPLRATSAPMFPPPAPAPMAMASAPKRSRLGLWLALGAVGLVVVGVGIAAVVAFSGKVAPMSSDYTGAPVSASDVAPDGAREILSSADTIALEVPLGWVNAGDYADISDASAGLPAGGEMVGAWFTSIPDGTTIPQLIFVFEATSGAAGIGSLSDFQKQAMGGLGAADDFEIVGGTTDVRTANGLDGKRNTATLDLDGGLTMTMVVETFGHGRRLALVMWTSYDGPVDEAALEALTDSLRVDA